MPSIWFTSDHHFFHENILKFKGENEELIRPEFEGRTVNEMNEEMIARWNAVVKPEDHVWHLGDVAFQKRAKFEEVKKLLQQLHGKKRLVVGNHDDVIAICKMQVFEKVVLWRGFHTEGFTCTHIPIMLNQLRDGAVNVHGHIHERLMPGNGYINVCVERRDYTPVHMDQIIQEIKAMAV